MVYLTPAYGKQCSSEEDLIRLWKSEKDFSICGMGPSVYTSIRDRDRLLREFPDMELVAMCGKTRLRVRVANIPHKGR